jgi:hypothetical protein
MASTSSIVMAFAIFVLAAHDCTFTERRIKKFGGDIEMSWLVYNLLPFVGLQLALAFGIMIPTLVLVSIFAVRNWTILLAIWLGAKLLNVRYQYLSLQLEAEIDRIRSASTRSSSNASGDSPSGEVP